MLIAYASFTGNIKRFVEDLKQFQQVYVKEGVDVNEPFVLITYSTGRGQIPSEVEAFLDANGTHLKGVIGSGNMNWGRNYCGSAVKISQQYNVPLLHTFEMRGSMEDVEIVASKILGLAKG